MRNPFQILVVLTAIFGLGLGAAFAGGTWWGRRDAPKAEATPTAAAASGASGGAGAATGSGGPGGAPGGAAGQATTGVVEEISGDTITVRTAAGGTVAIKLQADTQVRQLASASASDIRPGANVVVQGQPDVDGKVAARSVQITGTGQTGGAGGPMGGQGGGQGSQGQRSPGPRGTPTPTPAR